MRWKTLAIDDVTPERVLGSHVAYHPIKSKWISCYGEYQSVLKGSDIRSCDNVYQMTLRQITVCLCVLVLAGCGQESTPPQKATVKQKPLVIGLIPEQNIFKQFDRYEPLVGYLSGKIGTKISLKIQPTYEEILVNFKSEEMDGAFFGSFVYTLAHEKLGVKVLARPVALDNTSTYHGVIFVRKDSGIKSVRGMEGKRFAFVGKATFAGYLFPIEYFRHHGISNSKEYLKESYFAGTHRDAIYDVLEKKADIGAVKNTVFNRLAKADPRIKDDLVVLETSPDVPENAIALRKNIDESLRSSLLKALLNMHLDPGGRKVLEPFGAQRFIETRDEDYDVVRHYAEHMHLNMDTYEINNK
jgi:phosphonate transport system substrate-binding protein